MPCRDERRPSEGGTDGARLAVAAGRALRTRRSGRSGLPGRSLSAGGAVRAGRKLPRAKSRARRLRSLTLGDVIALLAMCLPFTLLRVSDTAATDVPPRAMKTATDAITLA